MPMASMRHACNPSMDGRHVATVKLEDIAQVQVHHDVSNHVSAHTHLTMAHHSVDSMSDDMSEPSSPESAAFDDTDLLSTPMSSDDVTAQLAAAGPVGMAAAAAIATGKKRKKPFSFETNPSIRKRQATRLLRKLKLLMTEFTTRVGQQGCIVVCSPGKVGSSFKCFGASPLENILKSRKNQILEELDASLAQQAPSMQNSNPDLHELPPLVIEGIPTPLDKMTQAQLRAFIPIMLKYSTGRGKPGWGREQTKPPWWPEDVPWANVRSDVRSDDEKKEVSWTNALRRVVRNCYQYHGREELLDAFSAADSLHDVQTATQVFTSQYPHLVHTINNVDGTVSIIQVDATGAVTTISESATHSEATQAVATLAEAAAASRGGVLYGTHTIDHTALGQDGHGVSAVEATLHDGQLILSDAVSAAAALVGVQDAATGIVSIPVQAAAAMMQIQGASIIPVSVHGGGVQFLAATSLPQFAVGNAVQYSGGRAVNHPHSPNSHDVNMQGDMGAEHVPTATQAVEVVTLSDQGAS